MALGMLDQSPAAAGPVAVGTVPSGESIPGAPSAQGWVGHGIAQSTPPGVPGTRCVTPGGTGSTCRAPVAPRKAISPAIREVPLWNQFLSLRVFRLCSAELAQIVDRLGFLLRNAVLSKSKCSRGMSGF